MWFDFATAGLQLRWKVVVEIWQLLLAAFGTYCLTLVLFPGLVSLVQHCAIGDWTPILLVAVFNFLDLIAKVVISLPLSILTVLCACSGWPLHLSNGPPMLSWQWLS